MNYIDNSRSFMIKYISHIKIILPLNTLPNTYLYISIYIYSIYPYIIFYTLCKNSIIFPTHSTTYTSLTLQNTPSSSHPSISHISKKVVAKHAIQFLLDNLDIPT